MDNSCQRYNQQYTVILMDYDIYLPVVGFHFQFSKQFLGLKNWFGETFTKTARGKPKGTGTILADQLLVFYYSVKLILLISPSSMVASIA